MRSRYVVLLLIAAALPAFSQTPPDLGFASSFAVLGGSNVTNAGATILAGNVGGNPVRGFSDAKFVLGEDRGNDALAQQGRKDAAAFYDNLANRSCTATLTGVPGNGQTLLPGVYCVSSSATLTGALTLDADSNPGAVWIFKIEGSLTTAAGSTVQTIDGGRDNNVFWRITSSATLGTKSVFAGNVLAAGNISVDSKATISGRLLTPAAVSLTDAGVTICCALLDMTPHVLPGGVSGADYNQTLTPAGGKAPYQFALVGSDIPTGATLTAGGALSVQRPATGVYKLAVAISDADGLSCIRVYRLVICGPITLSPLPRDPVACLSFNETITASGGTPPYTFTSTSLPAGFSLTQSGDASAVISITPPTAGPYSFTVTATDVFGCTGSRRYEGQIESTLKLLPPSGPLPDGTVGETYSQDFDVTGGSGNYTFTFSGTIPPALTPLPRTLPSSPRQTLAGPPMKGGCYEFTVTVTTDACAVVVSNHYTLVIRPVPVVFRPDKEELPPAKVCQFYCQEFTAKDCLGTYPFDAVIGEFPAGLPFDLETGKLCGTPLEAGEFHFTLFAQGVSHDYSLKVDDLAINPDPDPELPTATACVYYEHQLKVTGCKDGCTFKPAGLLPPDLELSEDGLLYKTPTKPGNYQIDVRVKPNGCPLEKIVSFHLTVLCNVTLTPAQLPPGRLGIFYSAFIGATCGTPDYTFTIVSGSPPPLLVLAPNTGRLAGVPTAVGCYTFRVRATDSASPACFGERTYTICISPVAVNAAPTLSGWGAIILAMFLAAAAYVALRR